MVFVVIILCNIVPRARTVVECFQGAKIEIEAVAVVGNIVDQD